MFKITYKIGDKVKYTTDMIPESLTFPKKNKATGKIVWIEPKDKKLPYQKVKVNSTITTMEDINLGD